MRKAILLISLGPVTLMIVAFTTGAHAAPIQAVIQACDNTAGCNYHVHENGDLDGCSPKVCFTCPQGTGQCHATPKTGTKKIGNLNGLVHGAGNNPSTGKGKGTTTSGGGMTHPVIEEHHGGAKH